MTAKTARSNKLKRSLSLLMSLLMAVSVFAGLDLGEIKVQALSGDALQNADTAAILSDMGLGWNLGNSLDATGSSGLSSETSWGNPKTTQALIDAVKAQGFNTVRVPVSWAKHTTSDSYTIDKDWMARVKEVVDYCYNNDMYVILNIHHDNNSNTNKNARGYYPSSATYTNAEKFVSSIWTQVADEFKDYDYHLIFETLNEPRLIGTNNEWWFNKWNPGSEVNDAISTINKLNQKAVDVIRASGSNNKGRLIMCPGYDASIDGATVSSYKLPTDIAGNENRLVVAIHAYSPYNFAMNVGSGSTSTYTTSIKNELKSLFDTIKTSFTDKGIPVVIGEFSTTDKNNTAERIKWAKDYTSQAKALNIPCMLWDNNAFAKYSGGKIVLNSEYHGYINRSNNTVTSPAKDVIEALMIPYAKPTLSISCSPLSLTYGESKKLGATASINGASLSYNSNSDVCAVDADGNVTALKAGTGSITVTASAEGFDNVTKTVNVTVSRKSISGANVQLSFTSADYTGSAITPSATVTIGGKALVNGTDYTVSFRNNVSAGTATAAFSGIGNYTGSVTKTFTIVGTELSKAVITVAKENYVYSGSAYKPAVSVVFEGKTLTEGTDYSVTYSSNTNAGSAKVTVTGKGGFTGTYTESFTISPADISSCQTTVSATAEFTGSNIAAPVTVKDQGKTLTEGKDFTVTYSNNKSIGTATATITGKGNYSGTVTKTFDIVPAKQTIQKLETRYKGFFVDWAQKGSATGYEVEYSTNSGFVGSFVRRLTKNKPDYDTFSGLTAGKTYYVRVRSYTNVGGKIYYGGWSASKSIVTAKYDIAKASVSGVANKAYTGKAITQSVTVKYSGKTLKNGSDYTVSYSANKNIGTATVTITGKGQYGGVIKKTFKINPAKQEIQKLTAKSKAFFVDWAKKGSATGYEIQYSTSSSFKNASKVTVTTNKTDTKTISKLSGNKKYYVRVRSYTTVNGVKYYGAWSATKSVTTKK